MENRGVVLRVILLSGPISRRDIANTTKLTSAAITNITGKLIADGLVIETGADKGQPRGGRRPILLDLNPSDPFVIGVHLGRTRALIGLTDLRGRQFGPQGELPLQQGKPPPVLAITGTIRRIVSESGRQVEQALGIGVGVAATPGAEPLSVKADLESALKIPTWVENNVRAIALAEAWANHDTDTGSFVLVYVGNVIGAAILIGDRVHPGFRQAAGRIGHLQVDPLGPRCDCGHRGCLEAVASDLAVFSQATEKAREHPDSLMARLLNGTTRPGEGVLKVVEAALGSDPVARELLTRRARYLGKALAMIGTLFDPERLVIAGTTFAAGAALQLPVIRDVIASTSPLSAGGLPLVTSRLGKEPEISGAAAVALNRFFAPI